MILADITKNDDNVDNDDNDNSNKDTMENTTVTHNNTPLKYVEDKRDKHAIVDRVLDTQPNSRIQKKKKNAEERME